MSVLRFILLCATLLGCSATAFAQNPSVDVKRAVDYANHDGVVLQADIYQPKEPGKYPAIVALHGGGWQSGSRISFQYSGPWLAERGFVVMAINYRLSKPGQKTYPQAVHDARAAVQFIRSKAETYKVDPDRIGMMGDSAGGHLAALIALAHDEAPFANGYPNDPYASVSAKVKAVVGFYGVYDMQQQWNHDLLHRPHDNIAQNFIGLPPTENRKLYNEASPMSYAVKSKNTTSFYIVHGTEDDIVDRAQSDNFLLALKQAGFFARHYVVQGAGHFFASDPLSEPRGKIGEAADPVLRFLKDRL